MIVSVAHSRVTFSLPPRCEQVDAWQGIYIYIYIIYSQDTVIDNIIAILYECEMCAV